MISVNVNGHQYFVTLKRIDFSCPSANSMEAIGRGWSASASQFFHEKGVETMNWPFCGIEPALN